MSCFNTENAGKFRKKRRFWATARASWVPNSFGHSCRRPTACTIRQNVVWWG